MFINERIFGRLWCHEPSLWVLVSCWRRIDPLGLGSNESLDLIGRDTVIFIMDARRQWRPGAGLGMQFGRHSWLFWPAFNHLLPIL